MKKSIGIIGGNFYNKGAEEMTCIVINEVAKKFPDHDMVLFSRVAAESSVRTARKYKITIVGGELFYKKVCWADILYFCLSGKRRDKQVIPYLEDMELLIEISGYGLLYRGKSDKNSFISYIHNLWIAKKYHIPIYLFPQSYGPFVAKNRIQRFALDSLLKIILKIPEKIYVREKFGGKIIRNYRREINYVPDMVLNYKDDIDLSMIYRNQSTCEVVYEIRSKSVVIIPNIHNINDNHDGLSDLYCKMINRLLLNDFEIYILPHAKDDVHECMKLKRLFNKENKVHLDTRDYTCFQLENIISKFSFGIISRYHAVVHAYRKAVPCVVIGWAEKYEELLDMFGQERYFYDIRDVLSEEALFNELEFMMSHYMIERKRLEKRYQAMKYFDIYKDLKLKDNG